MPETSDDTPPRAMGNKTLRSMMRDYDERLVAAKTTKAYGLDITDLDRDDLLVLLVTVGRATRQHDALASTGFEPTA